MSCERQTVHCFYPTLLIAKLLGNQNYMETIISRTCFVILIFCHWHIQAQTNDGLYVCFPEDPVNEFHSTGFEVGKTYFGLFEHDDSRFSLKELDGYDSLFISSDGKEYNYQFLNKTKSPQCIFSGESFRDTPKIAGLNLKDKMVLVGDTVYFYLNGTQYLIYSKGTPFVEGNIKSPPYSAIANYEIILRKKEGTSLQEQTLFKIDNIKWDSWFKIYTPRINFKWIGDLNQDGELDILITTSNHHECRTVIYLQSTPLNSSSSVKEKFRQNFCS